MQKQKVKEITDKLEGGLKELFEGEKCVDPCHGKGMKNVVTVGSANDRKYKGKKFAAFFKGTDIVILQDNDRAGGKPHKEMGTNVP